MADRYFSPVLVDSPEGRTYFPIGAWGPGYVLDARTEARFDWVCRRIVWLMMPLWPLSSFVGGQLGFGELETMLVAWLAFVVTFATIQAALLHGCPRSSLRPTSDQLLRLAAEQRGVLGLAVALACGMVVSLAVFVGSAILLEGVERIAFVSLAALAFAWAFQTSRRLDRIDTPVPRRLTEQDALAAMGGSRDDVDLR